MKKITFILLFLFSFNAHAQNLSFEKTDEGAWIKEDGEKVFFYQEKTKSKDDQYPRADYIHPLYGIDGFELTEDFPKDHLHHHGIFWAWHQLFIGEKKIGDAWMSEDFEWNVRVVKQGAKKDGSISLVTKTYWESPLWKDGNGDKKPFLEENTIVNVHAKTDNYRVIDFEISLLALEPDLKIGGSDDKKGYGGFCVRMKMPADIKFTSENGEVTPMVEAVSAGPWMNVSGSLAKDGGNAGIIIMCHPDNPMFPEQWILRKKGSMQNPAYPGRKPILVSENKPTVLKYKLVVYKGQLSKKVIEGIFAGQN